MKRLMKLVRKDERGFTLMELMIVLVIIGILAAIAVPRFTQTANTAREKACLANVRTLQNALELYYAENNSYPEDNNIDLLATYVSGGIPKCPSQPANDPTSNYTITSEYDIDNDGTNDTVIDCSEHGYWNGSGLTKPTP